MIETIEFNGREYPHFQTEGNAAQYAIPFAKKICRGVGYDIGCGKLEWALNYAIPIDPKLNKEHDALNLPIKDVDFIFSSHCLEHLEDWVRTLDYWTETLKEGGTLFLYLPDYSQEYWRPWNNTQHRNILSPRFIGDYLEHVGYKKIFVSGVDLMNSFMVMGEKGVQDD